MDSIRKHLMGFGAWCFGFGLVWLCFVQLHPVQKRLHTLLIRELK
jgi:hypothetical protein